MVFANMRSRDTFAAFCVLSPVLDEIWARFFGSSLEDRLRYTPSDCFETFPFHADWATHPTLEASGRAYYEYRAKLMLENNEGLTKTYNRVHDIYEADQRTTELRKRHDAMDQAVLEIYGWTDIPAECEFLLDYEIEETEETTWGRKKKPYRYRWTDSVHDEVLSRLLALNAKHGATQARTVI